MVFLVSQAGLRNARFEAGPLTGRASTDACGSPASVGVQSLHFLVEVPRRPEVFPDETEVLRRLKAWSGAAISAGKAQQMLAMFAEAKDGKGAAVYLEQFYQRMWDLSGFVKLLKHRLRSGSIGG